jgi:flagellar basal body rod protein FlgG
MSDLLSIAASGIQAANTELNVTANNIANMNTPGFKPSRVDLAAAPSGGVDVVRIEPLQKEVDPATEMVKLKQEVLTYDANGLLVNVADRMYGSLLNVLDSDDQNSGWNKNG